MTMYTVICMCVYIYIYLHTHTFVGIRSFSTKIKLGSGVARREKVYTFSVFCAVLSVRRVLCEIWGVNIDTAKSLQVHFYQRSMKGSFGSISAKGGTPAKLNLRLLHSCRLTWKLRAQIGQFNIEANSQNQR